MGLVQVLGEKWNMTVMNGELIKQSTYTCAYRICVTGPTFYFVRMGRGDCDAIMHAPWSSRMCHVILWP